MNRKDTSASDAMTRDKLAQLFTVNDHERKNSFYTTIFGNPSVVKDIPAREIDGRVPTVLTPHTPRDAMLSNLHGKHPTTTMQDQLVTAASTKLRVTHQALDGTTNSVEGFPMGNASTMFGRRNHAEEAGVRDPLQREKIIASQRQRIIRIPLNPPQGIPAENH